MGAFNHEGRTYPQSQYEATLGLNNLTNIMAKSAGHNLFMVSPKVTIERVTKLLIQIQRLLNLC